MKMLVVNRKCVVFILITFSIVFGMQDTSYAQQVGNLTITVSTRQPLTDVTLNGSVVRLTLSGGTYERWLNEEHAHAFKVSGIRGVTLRSTFDSFNPFSDVERVSNAAVTVELDFAGNMDTDATLTFTLGADAIANYEGPPLTAEIPVTVIPKSLEASTVIPLTKETLDGSVVTLTLSGVAYKWFLFDTKNVTVSGIAGVTIRRGFGVRRASDTEITVELEFDGNLSRDGTLTFTVEADLITNYNGPPLTAEIPVYSVIKTQVLVDESQRAPMYWINTKVGMLQSLTRATVVPLMSSRLRITSLAVDAVAGKIYWAERTGDSAGTIKRVNLNGTNVELLTTLSDVPVGIAIDTAGDKLYWTNSHKAIQSADLNGENIRTVIHLADEIAEETSESCVKASGNAGGKLSLLWGLIEVGGNVGSSVESCTSTETNLNMTSPTDIAVDSIGGKLYWIELSGRVRRVNLDGTNLDTLVTDLGTPGGITVADGKVYWTEGTDIDQGKIQRANLNGTNVETLAVLQGIPVGIAVDTADGKVYWANAYGVIQRTDINGGEIENVAFVTAPSDLALGSATRATPVTSAVPDASSTLSISPSSAASPSVGEQLTLSLNIAGGKEVAGYQATLQFDTTSLRYIESSNGDYLPDGAFFVPPIVDGSRVTLNATSLAGESNGDGSLATLTFKVIAVKPSTLTLSDVLLVNSLGKTSTPKVKGAQITESTQLTGDVNADGIINIQDLVLVSSNIGQTGQNAADINEDGFVNIVDLVLVAGALGNAAAAPALLHPNSLEILTSADVQLWLSQAQHLPLTDPTSLRGILFLEQLLAALIPKETVLLPNYPNPFNPETWIPYQLSESTEVTITIYAVNGHVVRRLALGHQPAGMYQNRSRAAYWDGRNAAGEPVASGVYFYTFTASKFTATRKMVILK